MASGGSHEEEEEETFLSPFLQVRCTMLVEPMTMLIGCTHVLIDPQHHVSLSYEAKRGNMSFSWMRGGEDNTFLSLSQTHSRTLACISRAHTSTIGPTLSLSLSLFTGGVPPKGGRKRGSMQLLDGGVAIAFLCMGFGGGRGGRVPRGGGLGGGRGSWVGGRGATTGGGVIM